MTLYIKEKPKELGQLIAYDKAIEIVKQGGVGKKVVEQMIIEQYEKPFVPKYANYDYVPVYDGNDRFIG